MVEELTTDAIKKLGKKALEEAAEKRKENRRKKCERRKEEQKKRRKEQDELHENEVIYIKQKITAETAEGKKTYRRNYLFSYLDKAIRREGRDGKFICILGDSGMGKSCALSKYFCKYSRKKCRKFSMDIIAFRDKDWYGKVSNIPDKENTVLLLDGLDENQEVKTKYNNDFNSFFSDYFTVLNEFALVVISCRTQFFKTKDNEPYYTENTKAISSQSPMQFTRLYLRQFDERQVRKYLRRKYWIRLRSRRKAQLFVKKCSGIMSRPLILSNIDIIMERDTHQSMLDIYDTIVDGWFQRDAEKNFKDITPKKVEEIKGNIWVNSVQLVARMFMENRLSMTMEEYSGLFEDIKVILPQENHLDVDVFRLNSLLTRVGNDNWEFVHKSFYEYFLAYAFFIADAGVDYESLRGYDNTLQFCYDLAIKNGMHGPVGIPYQLDGIKVDTIENVFAKLKLDLNEIKRYYDAVVSGQKLLEGELIRPYIIRDYDEIGSLKKSIGILYFSLHQKNVGMNYMLEARESFRSSAKRSGSVAQLAFIDWQLGNEYRAMSQIREADKFYDEAERLKSRIRIKDGCMLCGTCVYEVKSLISYGFCLFKSHDYEIGNLYFSEAIDTFNWLGEKEKVECFKDMAHACLAQIERSLSIGQDREAREQIFEISKKARNVYDLDPNSNKELVADTYMEIYKLLIDRDSITANKFKQDSEEIRNSSQGVELKTIYLF